MNPAMCPHSRRSLLRAASRAVPLLALMLVPAPSVRADGTTCVFPPLEGGPLPAHAREARARMRAHQPPVTAGFVERAHGVAERIRAVERGLLRADDVPAGALAVTGTLSIPVLPMRFANTTADPFNPVSLEARLFLFGTTGTMTEYFDEVSYGNLNVTGDVHGWRDAPENDTVYEGTDNGLWTTIGPFLTAAFEQHDVGVDFGLYDNDGPDNIPDSGDDDGVVDIVFIVHPEMGGECGPATNANIWSHHSHYSNWFGGAYVTNDPGANGQNIRIDRYCISPGLSCSSGMIEIGVFCHELGHALGVPDLYDTDDDVTGSSRGIGDWGLMGGGSSNSPSSPAHMTAFTKHHLGWLTYVNLLQNDPWLCLPPVELNPTAVRVWPQGEITHEYFLVENRQNIGFDANLWNEGFVIYHVDENRYDALLHDNAVNANEAAKAVDVECADAFTAQHVVDADSLDLGDSGSPGNVFCDGGGQDSFTPFTTPDTRSNSGDFTGIGIRQISECDGISGPDGGSDGLMVCGEFTVGVAAPVDVCIEDCRFDHCNQIATCENWWGSPDIWINNDDDASPEFPAPGVKNRLWTRVHNDGTEPAVATTAYIYIAKGAMGLEWPADAAAQIGQTGFPVIAPGEAPEDHMIFQYPDLLELTGHWCIGVVLQQTYDPAVSQQAFTTNNIAQVNRQVLIDRASGGGLARGGGCGDVEFQTWIHLYDGYNPTGGGVVAQVRLGSPPNYNDVQLPAGWTVDVSPQGNFQLGPGITDSVLVTIQASGAGQLQIARVPLSLFNLETQTTIGGTTIDAIVDCVAPAAVQNFAAGWRDPHGDNVSGPNVRIDWDTVVLDEQGGPELVQYYEIYRAAGSGIPVLVDRVAIDADDATPGMQFHDTVPAGDCPAEWTYTIRAVDYAEGAGAFAPPFVLECTDPATSVAAMPAPAGSRLLAPAPNPARTSTVIGFQLDRAGDVDVTIYNARGERVRRLWTGHRAAGSHELRWDGRDDDGRQLASGVYFTRAELPGGRKETRKIVLSR